MGKGGPGLVGHLRWTITDAATGTEIGQGERDLRANDVVVEVVEGGPTGKMTNKTVNLSNRFTLSLAVGPSSSESDLSGFGFTAMNEGEQSFSWEWFVVDRTGHATKLQESGELAIRLSQGEMGWTVARTEFLTDVSMRVLLMASPESMNPKWRVVIHKGSWIEWPG